MYEVCCVSSLLALAVSVFFIFYLRPCSWILYDFYALSSSQCVKFLCCMFAVVVCTLVVARCCLVPAELSPKSVTYRLY